MTSKKLSDNPIYFSSRILTLDGIRGLAILLVLLHHFSLNGGMKPTVFLDKLFYQMAYSGWIGVDLFFVLSGFLITGILCDTKGSHYFFRNFYMRRFLRIFPLYYGFLAVHFLVLPYIFSFGDQYVLSRNNQMWYWTYLTNIGIATKGWEEFGHIGHFWTLAIEEQFYLFWPLLVSSFDRRKLCLICVLLIMLAFGVRLSIFSLELPRRYAYIFTIARMDSLSIGALIALLSRNPMRQVIMNLWAKPVLVICGFALFGIFFWKGNLSPGDPIMYTIGFTVVSGFFGALIYNSLNTLSDKLAGKFFSNRILIFLGVHSYAIYVFHPAVIWYLRSKGFTVHLLPSILESQLLGQFIYIATAFAGSLIISLLSWYLWESRFLRLKRLFPYTVKK